MSTLQEKIAVMSAFAKGVKIEYRRKSYRLEWRSADDPSWNWEEFDYRIQPEPVKPQRTHKEIMSNWFKGMYGYYEYVEFNPDKNTYFKYYFNGDWRSKDYFNTLEMLTDEQIRNME